MALIKDFLDKIKKYPLKKSEDDDEAETIIGKLEDTLRCKEIAFYIATSYIANTISKCPFKVYRDGQEVKNDLFYVLNVKSNPNEVASKLKYKLIEKLYYEGESLIFDYDNNLYCADSFNIDYYPLKGNVFTNITLDNETEFISDRSSHRVFYFNLENDNHSSKIKKFINSMSEDYNKIIQYAIEIYKDSNSEKYTLDLGTIGTGNESFKKEYDESLKEQLKSFIESRKAVYPQYQGYKLDKLVNNVTPTDSTDIRNIKKDIFETVAEAFKMPIAMLYGNMTNAKEIITQYLTFTIDPLAEMISQELTANSFSIEEYKNGCYVKVDTTAINHLDIFDIADKIEKTISTGIFCVDEIRVKLGESPLNTEWSKKHYITKNYSSVDEFWKNIVKGGDEN